MMLATVSQKARKFLKVLKVDALIVFSILKPNSYAKVLEHAQLAEELIVARHQRITHIHAQ